jgi:uncharacterized repeat protein (TIGR03803 family)
MNSKGFPRIARLGLAFGVLLFTATGEAFAQGFKVIHANTGADAGVNTLIQNPGDGLFYGTSLGGGIGFGSIFKMDAAGTITTIHSFAGPPTDGQYPKAGLFLNGDGYFYGTCSIGGSMDNGSVFKIDAAGTSYSTHLLACDAEGSTPTASFMLASDGKFYVSMSTDCGGINTYGDVSQVDTSLNVNAVSTFYYLGPIAAPPSHLVEGADTYLYGTSGGGYSNVAGSVYRIPLGGGDPVAVHLFNGLDGSGPIAPLLLASDGNFYGTTQFVYDPNPHNTGTIFKVAADGTFSTVHFFNGVDGGIPQSGLTQASDGFLYGATENTLLGGTIYRIDTAGNFTLLASAFDVGLGFGPVTELLEGSDGKLYGATAIGGGPNQYGTVFAIDLTQKIDSITPNSGPAAGGTPVVIAGAGFVTGATVNIGSVVATGVSVPDAAHVNATTPANNPGTLQTVKVFLPDTTAIVLNGGWFSDFLDVPTGDIFHDYVRKLLSNGITAGCGGGNYCRNNAVTRAQMAVFLLKAEHGLAYVPPFCTGIFPDVPCTPGTGFPDWIEELSNEGITGGCGGGNYCPGNPVTRQQMAVFLLKTEHGSGYTPPGCTGIFGDVACPSPFADWIERLYAENVTGGCQVSPLLYCPGSSVLRGQMAAFLSKTFNLP